MRWDDMRWDEILWHEVWWSLMRWGVIKFNEMRWDDIKFNEMRWDEMRWYITLISTLFTFLHFNHPPLYKHIYFLYISITLFISKIILLFIQRMSCHYQIAFMSPAPPVPYYSVDISYWFLSIISYYNFISQSKS